MLEISEKEFKKRLLKMDTEYIIAAKGMKREAFDSKE